MKFKPGDKVVCVDFAERTRNPKFVGLLPNKEYTVLSVNTRYNNICIDGARLIGALGLKPGECDDSGAVMASRPWNADRFELATVKSEVPAPVPEAVALETAKRKFKPGDRVVCVNSGGASTNLVVGKEYIVEANRDGCRDVWLHDVTPPYWEDRFVIAKEKKKMQQKRVGLSTKSLAKRNLVNAEDLFLRAFGWKKRRGGLYEAPSGYISDSVKGPVSRRHAINSQAAK